MQKDLGYVRVAAAVPRMQVADTQFNTREIIDQIHYAAEEQVEVICFPELCVTGYTCADLFGQNRLLEDAEAAVAQIVAKTAKLDAMVVFGTPVRHAGRLRN